MSRTKSRTLFLNTSFDPNRLIIFHPNQLSFSYFKKMIICLNGAKFKILQKIWIFKTFKKIVHENFRLKLKIGHKNLYIYNQLIDQNWMISQFLFKNNLTSPPKYLKFNKIFSDLLKFFCSNNCIKNNL